MIGWGVDGDQTVANSPMFRFFSFCIYTGITPTRRVAVEVPYNHPVFTVWLKSVEIDCFVGWTVMVRFLSGRMSFTVIYSMSATSGLLTSMDGIPV